MASAWAEWGKVRSQVDKILGSSGEVPDVTGAITKADEQFQKCIGEFETARDAMGEAILTMDNANSGLQNAAEQFRAKIEKLDFGLDPKKDAKKLADARKVISGFIADRMTAYKSNDKMMDELTKHLNQLGKYKPV